MTLKYRNIDNVYVSLYTISICTIRVEGFEILLFHTRINGLNAFHVCLYDLIHFRSSTIYGTYWPNEIPCDEINSFRKGNFPFRNKQKESKRKVCKISLSIQTESIRNKQIFSYRLAHLKILLVMYNTRFLKYLCRHLNRSSNKETSMSTGRRTSI